VGRFVISLGFVLIVVYLVYQLYKILSKTTGGERRVANRYISNIRHFSRRVRKRRRIRANVFVAQLKARIAQHKRS
jgi:hypothetical protein